MNYKLARNILTRPWAISPLYIATLGPMLYSFLEKGEAYISSTETPISPETTNTENINILNIKGELMKDDEECGSIGMRTMGNIITEKDNDENIVGHILIIDSPGGTVDGTMELASVIENTKKPIIAVVDGMAASAAYWIASACDSIIALNEFAEVGSIGVMLSFADVQPYYEKQGVKFHRIYSSHSQDKNKDFEEILKGNYKNYINETLDPLAEKFISSVKKNRQLTSNQLTGKTFFAKDVLGTMVDSIGTIENAITKIHNNQPKITNMAETEKGKNNFFFKIFSKSLGKEITNEEDLFSAQLEKIDALEKENGELKAKIETLEKEGQKEAKSQNENKEMLDSAQSKITELEAKVTELEKLPGAKETTVKKETDSKKEITETVVSEEKSFMENLAAVKERYFETTKK